MQAEIAAVVMIVTAAVGCRDVSPAPTASPVTTLPPILRVCADPNNLPFSNERLEGFENELAELVGRDLGVPVEYTWFAQRRGFLRSTLNAGACDVVMGLPTSVEAALTTRPYYRSTYVFVTRRDTAVQPRSFDDAVLRTARIGVPLVGDDGANAPPAHALSRRGIIRNVVGFSVYGDYRRESPPSAIIEAVAHGDVDVAVAWGPTAGYFASRQAVPLAISPVEPQIDQPFLPFVFDISLGVRRDAPELHARLDELLQRRKPEIDEILARFHVPRLDAASEPVPAATSLAIAVLRRGGGQGVLAGFELGAGEARRMATLIGHEWVETEAESSSAAVILGSETPLMHASGAAFVVSAHPLGPGAAPHVYSVRATQAARAAAVAAWRRSHPDAEVSAVEWHASLSRFGAEQLNTRFAAGDIRAPDAEVWAGWMAAKVVAEVLARQRATPDAPLSLTFDGHKGTPLRFDPENRHLRQPLAIVGPDGALLGMIDPHEGES